MWQFEVYTVDLGKVWVNCSVMQATIICGNAAGGEGVFITGRIRLT